jgi:hypothetical protein
VTSPPVQQAVPNFWDTQRWGRLNNRMDYLARCLLRTDPMAWSHLVAYTRRMLTAVQSRDQRLKAERDSLTPVERGKLEPLKLGKLGIKCCVERMRYEVLINRGRYNDVFEFPNEYTSYFARLLVVEIDGLADYVKRRKVKQDLTWQASLDAGTLHTP